MVTSFAYGSTNKLPILKVTKTKICNEKKKSTIQKEFYYFTSKYNGKISLPSHKKTPHQVPVLSFRIPLHSWILNSFTKFVLLIVLPIKISSFIVGGNCDFVMHNERWQIFFEFTH